MACAGAHTPVDVDARKQARGVSPRCGRHPAQGARGRLQGRGRSWRTAGAAASVHAAAMIEIGCKFENSKNRTPTRRRKGHGPVTALATLPSLSWVTVRVGGPGPPAGS